MFSSKEDLCVFINKGHTLHMLTMYVESATFFYFISNILSSWKNPLLIPKNHILLSISIGYKIT